MSDTHVLLASSHRQLRQGARRVRDVDPHTRVHITVTLAGPALPSADEFPAERMSRETFASKYGVPSDKVNKVRDVLRRYGLSVDDITQSGRSLHVSGSAAAIEAAFKARLGVYYHSTQGEYRGREGDIMIPSDLAGIVEGVHGLDQRQVAHRKAGGAAPNGTLAPLGPPDLERHYSFPNGAAEGQVVAIAEFGQAEGTTVVPPVYLPNDVTAFCNKYNRSSDVHVLPVNLAPLTVAQFQQLPQQLQEVSADEAGEVMMDVEIVAALCSKATVQVYFATFDQKGWVDLLDAVTTATPMPVALSVSWGAPEDSPDWSEAALTAINERLQIAAMHGMTICVSAGDDGSGDGMTGKAAHVDFPAASPFVLAVGGTQINATAAGQQEAIWWESPGRRTRKGGGATGGGVSVKFKRPTWQTVQVKSINPGAMDGRVVSDVSALAGDPLYDLVFGGWTAPNGGTSASAPLWASLIARINALLPAAKQQRFLTPLLYAKQANGKTLGETACKDIAGGDNASHPAPGRGYPAVAGFDAPTGWGVPDGQALLNGLTAQP